MKQESSCFLVAFHIGEIEDLRALGNQKIDINGRNVGYQQVYLSQQFVKTKTIFEQRVLVYHRPVGVILEWLSRIDGHGMRLYDQFAAIDFQPGMQLLRIRLAQPQYRIGLRPIVSLESTRRIPVGGQKKK